MARRRSILELEGSLTKRVINGIEYFAYRKYYDKKRKQFYGKTIDELEKKVLQYEHKLSLNID